MKSANLADMKKLLLIIGLSVCGIAMQAQQPDFTSMLAAHPEYLDGTDYLCPTGKTVSTAPPEGYKAFYISHFGRHGSRYAWQSGLYDYLYGLFSDAALNDNLTAVGKEFWERYKALYPDVRHCTGSLTARGWRQEEELGELMFSSFPEVFPDGASVTARTSPEPRCIMSMSSFCLGLKGCRPSIDIRGRQSGLDLPIVCPSDKNNRFKVTPEPTTGLPFAETSKEYTARTVDCGAILGRLFKDPAAAVEKDREWYTVNYLSFLVKGMQGLDTDLDFSFIFTGDERVALWKADCVSFYCSAWKNRFKSQPILDDIAAYARRRMDGGFREGADLRFSHDSYFLPILMLLDVNGFGTTVTSADEVPSYCQLQEVPMGANLQFVFYRPEETGKPVLFKLLLNGREARIGMPTGIWPYYEWEEFAARFTGKPLIGISSCLDNGRSFVPATYSDAIVKAGGIPVPLPTAGTAEQAREALVMMDGVLFTGGEDIAPAWYGEEILNSTVESNPQRDTSDMLLAGEALRRGMPVLGICRGCQMLNVAMGGTLYQDIPTQKRSRIVHRQTEDDPMHTVRLSPASRLYDLLGTRKIETNSYHHQCVKAPAPGLRITAKATDGIVEGYEAPNVLGVQFHPEKHIAAGDDTFLVLFKDFVESAKKP